MYVIGAGRIHSQTYVQVFRMRMGFVMERPLVAAQEYAKYRTE